MKVAFIYLIFSIALILTIYSCSGTISEKIFKQQEWTENLALEDGVKSNVPEIIDGNLETVGKAVFPEGVYGKPFFGAPPSAEAVITLPRQRMINKIVIHSDDLKDFKVMASAGGPDGKEDWKLIKEFNNNRLREIVIRTSVVTDKILIRARGKTPIETTETTRVIGGIIVSRKLMEPEIREVELYGYK